jgi:hypothetical protein
MNFRATVVAMAAASAAVPASIGGMNMPHGFENAPTEMFWTVAGCIGFTAFASWYGFMRRFRMAGELTNARASELASMQYILSNMDTLDDAFGARAMRGEASSGFVTRDAESSALAANVVMQFSNAMDRIAHAREQLNAFTSEAHAVINEIESIVELSAQKGMGDALELCDEVEATKERLARAKHFVGLLNATTNEEPTDESRQVYRATA